MVEFNLILNISVRVALLAFIIVALLLYKILGTWTSALFSGGSLFMFVGLVTVPASSKSEESTLNVKNRLGEVPLSNRFRLQQLGSQSREEQRAWFGIAVVLFVAGIAIFAISHLS
jgi:hypothetical protein